MSDYSSTTSGQTFDRTKFVGKAAAAEATPTLISLHGKVRNANAVRARPLALRI